MTVIFGQTGRGSALPSMPTASPKEHAGLSGRLLPTARMDQLAQSTGAGTGGIRWQPHVVMPSESVYDTRTVNVILDLPGVVHFQCLLNLLLSRRSERAGALWIYHQLAIGTEANSVTQLSSCAMAGAGYRRGASMVPCVSCLMHRKRRRCRPCCHIINLSQFTLWTVLHHSDLVQ